MEARSWRARIAPAVHADLAVFNVANSGSFTYLTDTPHTDEAQPDWRPLADVIAPDVTLATPSDGGACALTSTVLADYACADESGAPASPLEERHLRRRLVDRPAHRTHRPPPDDQHRLGGSGCSGGFQPRRGPAGSTSSQPAIPRARRSRATPPPRSMGSRRPRPSARTSSSRTLPPATTTTSGRRTGLGGHLPPVRPQVGGRSVIRPNFQFGK
jgi:hypothetical protein